MSERRDPRISRTRERVFGAAMGLALEKGFAAVTMQDVCARSGASKSTLYRYWTDIDALFLDALGERAQAHQPPGRGAVRADLVQTMMAFSGYLQSPYGAMMIHLASAAASKEVFAEVHTAYCLHHREVALVSLRAGQARGELPQTADLGMVQEDLVGAILYRRFFLKVDIGPGWVAAHVDRVLRSHGYVGEAPSAGS